MWQLPGPAAGKGRIDESPAAAAKLSPLPPPQGIANRDIKLENALLDDSPLPLLKICDFGYSKVRPQGCPAAGWHATLWLDRPLHSPRIV